MNYTDCDENEDKYKNPHKPKCSVAKHIETNSNQ
jgi:hypothetical protein